jgi:NAD(P)-dependent dehydrogenase (short-subunit alcohol dehydrogenase family)
MVDGKRVIVTGAGGGIGRATALRLARGGARVACVDIDEDAVSSTADAITDAGDQADNEEMVRLTAAELGGVDALHANAAVQRMGRIDETSLEDWDELFRVNLRGVGLGVRAVLPELVRAGGGSVVMTASLLGMVGDPDLPAYGAMKGGLLALCRALATAHGPQNVRVNTVCPGDVLTPMVEQYFAHQPDPQQARATVEAQYPLRRMAAPDDVAAVVAFLISDEARYLSGIDIPVDGGLLARIY